MQSNGFSPVVCVRRAALCVICLSLTGCLGSMKPGDMAWVKPETDAPRAGHVYLIRGLIGLFSFGIDRLTNEINQAGVRSHVYQQDQHNTLCETLIKEYGKGQPHEPLCLVGHSVGANNVIEISRELDKHDVTVDLLITIDGTEKQIVPKNVRVCYNYYQPSLMDFAGILCGVPLRQDPASTGKLFNYDIRKERRDLMEWDTTHVNVDKNQKIHKEVIGHLLEVCPPREQWLAMKNAEHATTLPTVRANLRAPATASSGLQAVAPLR